MKQRVTWRGLFLSAAAGLLATVGAAAGAPVVGGSLDPLSIPQFVEPLVIPPVMPAKGVQWDPSVGKLVPYYEIEVVQFGQQILPSPLPSTTVWSYGAVGKPQTRRTPSWTIENWKHVPTRVKWINNLVDGNGNYLPHLLPIDQTLHWANPPKDCIEGMPMTDCRGDSQEPYTGPVPIITHLHGAHVQPDSDGYPEAWYLPRAKDIPKGYARQGTLYDDIFGGSGRNKGFAVFQYPNDQRPTTLWFHDHSLGMTRANVYAGPTGFYLIREPSDVLLGLPLPAPLPGVDPNQPKVRKFIREIPLVIQDKAFNTDGSLFYPDNRAFFESLNFPSHPDPQFPGAGDLVIPFIPDLALSGARSDVSPIWNPEFFGNTMVVNGNTWPYLDVQQSRYRFRFLNASDSRFLLLKLATDNTPADNSIDDGNYTVIAGAFAQIGADGGFLPNPVVLDSLLLGPAERADVIVDFGKLPLGKVYLVNQGPDEPFGGGTPFFGCAAEVPPPDAPEGCFEPSDAATTGKVMQFRVGPRTVPELSKPVAEVQLPEFTPLGPADNADNPRKLSLNEDMSMTVCVKQNPLGPNPDDPFDVVETSCDDPDGEPFGPTSARLGIVDAAGFPVAKSWMEDITEKPRVGDTEIWEIYNFTADAHPIHVHLVQFEVVDRQDLVTDADGVAVPPAQLVGAPRGPEAWETGTKDTVIVYPGTVARLKAKFDIPGLYVWHCHILSHEDNEMMRPIEVVPAALP